MHLKGPPIGFLFYAIQFSIGYWGNVPFFYIGRLVERDQDVQEKAGLQPCSLDFVAHMSSTISVHFFLDEAV